MYANICSLSDSSPLQNALSSLLYQYQVAHPLVQKQLVDYIHNGFLVPVMGPALHKVRVMMARQIKGIRLRNGYLNAKASVGGSGQGTLPFSLSAPGTSLELRENEFVYVWKP